jgi:hypothetical protein
MRTPDQLIRELQKIFSRYFNDKDAPAQQAMDRASRISRDVNAGVLIMQQVLNHDGADLTTAALDHMTCFPNVVRAHVPTLDSSDLAAVPALLRELRPWVVRKEIADGLLGDMQDIGTGSALAELDQQGKAANTSLKDYAAWRKAFDKLVKEVGIERNAIRGPSAPKGLNPDGVLNLSLNEMKVLATFPSTDGGKKDVTSLRAGIYLDKFYKAYAPLLMEVVQENALQSAAIKMTKFWQKHVELLAEITKDSTYYAHKSFYEGITQLAKNPSHASQIGTGFAKPEHYEVDPQKLEAALAGQSAAGNAVANLGTEFFKISRLANSHNHYRFETKTKDMQQEYFRDVKPAMEELKSVTGLLETARAEHAASLRYRVNS